MHCSQRPTQMWCDKQKRTKTQKNKISQALVVAVTVSAIQENVAHLYDHCSISSICKSESLVAPLFIATAQSMKLTNAAVWASYTTNRECTTHNLMDMKKKKNKRKNDYWILQKKQKLVVRPSFNFGWTISCLSYYLQLRNRNEMKEEEDAQWMRNWLHTIPTIEQIWAKRRRSRANQWANEEERFEGIE